MQKAIVEDHAETDFALAAVWIPMLPFDGLRSARKAATRLFPADPRIAHFYDGNKSLGKSLSEQLAWGEQVAWDIYLFYPAAARWEDTPPEASSYWHQVTAIQHDERRVEIDQLESKLRQSFAEILHEGP